jgi:hypothetical protein
LTIGVTRQLVMACGSGRSFHLVFFVFSSSLFFNQRPQVSYNG